jgi:hypothetical protein
MAKTKGGKIVKSKPVAEKKKALDGLLLRQSKETLVGLLVELAETDRALKRRIEDAVGAETSADQLVQETRQAIADATYFDERRINYNFDYDMAAYERVHKNLKRLVSLDRMDDGMKLAIELMKAGSYQIEMSDEGAMTPDVENCLTPVIAAVAKSNLRSEQVISWCDAMTGADRVGFVCDRLIRELRDRSTTRNKK